VSDVERYEGGFLLTFSSLSEEILAQKLVVCAGAHTNFLPWLPKLTEKEPKFELDLDVVTQTVSYVRVAEMSEDLANMPSMVLNYDDGLLDGAYILPPIK